MPYFKWTGITLVGDIKRGKLPAHSQKELARRLEVQGVALLSSKVVLTLSPLWPISVMTKSHVFGRIAQLLKVGIPLPDALTISAEQSDHPLMYDILFTSAVNIKHGEPFTHVLKGQKKFYDSVAHAMLMAGYEAGNVMSAYEALSCYYKAQHSFRKKVSAALAVPCITFLFFIMVSFLIFIFIIPRFADMFASLSHQLPPLTVFVLRVSQFIRSMDMLILAGSIGVCFIIVYLLSRRMDGFSLHRVMEKVPFVGRLISAHQWRQAFGILSLLMKNGFSLPDAFEVVTNVLPEGHVKMCCAVLCHDVQTGRLLSDAMRDLLLFIPEVIAVVCIGEESSGLPIALDHAAGLYDELLQKMLHQLVFFLQPFLIILLGIVIMTLIFSVYLPIMELSKVF